MFTRFRAIVVVSLAYIVLWSATAQDDVDSAIHEVFESEDPTSPTPPVDENSVTCECVPFYLCNENNTLNEYGENVIDIRFGESECPHYMDKCCSSTELPNPSVTPNPKRHSCGNRNIDGVGFKITGGFDNEANYGEFPWMVALINRSNGKMECGGSIIHPKVILTGAHCVKGKKNLSIKAGEWDTQTEKEIYPTQVRNVESIMIHENYYAGGVHNDIALLILETALELSSVVDTICLPEQGENMDGRNCIVSGWGKDVFGKEGKNQVILKKIEQPIIARKQCQESLRKTQLGSRFKLHDSHLCAGGLKGIDSCKGDGGGPLVCSMKDKPEVYVQAGIVAWGIGCGTETPALYSNVPIFRKWIDSKLDSLNLS